MGIRQYNPITAGRRGASVSDFAELTKGCEAGEIAAASAAQKGRPQQSGSHHRPASRRRSQAAVSLDRFPPQQGRRAGQGRTRFSTIPNRSARIALLHFVDGEKRYILAPDGLKVGQTVESGPDAPPNVGNCLPLQQHSAGHARFTTSNCSRAAAARLCRSAGSSATLDGPRGRLGADHAAQRRNSPHPVGLPGDDRRRSAMPIT